MEDMGLDKEAKEINPKPVELTQDQRDLLLRGAEDPDVQKLIEEKGIAVGEGNQLVSVDGKEFSINTSPEDFGVRVVEEAKNPNIQ